MSLKPIFTEKSFALANDKKYSFWVPRGWNKGEIKRYVSSVFGVKVLEVKTINYKLSRKKNIRGKFVTKSARKKAIVVVSPKDKIEIFSKGGKGK